MGLVEPSVIGTNVAGIKEDQSIRRMGSVGIESKSQKRSTLLEL
jgi:hypothetical protein